MHSDLEQAISFHESIVAEGGKALVGYDTAKALANVVLLSEIPTSYDKKEQRQVNAGNLLLRGVPGVGKTFFGVILADIAATGDIHPDHRLWPAVKSWSAEVGLTGPDAIISLRYPCA